VVIGPVVALLDVAFAVVAAAPLVSAVVVMA